MMRYKEQQGVDIENHVTDNDQLGILSEGDDFYITGAIAKGHVNVNGEAIPTNQVCVSAVCRTSEAGLTIYFYE